MNTNNFTTFTAGSTMISRWRVLSAATLLLLSLLGVNFSGAAQAKAAAALILPAAPASG